MENSAQRILAIENKNQISDESINTINNIDNNSLNTFLDERKNKVWHKDFKASTIDDIWFGQANSRWTDLRMLKKSDINHIDLAITLRRLQPALVDDFVVFPNDKGTNYHILTVNHVGIWMEGVGNIYYIDHIIKLRTVWKKNICEPLENLKKILQYIIKNDDKVSEDVKDKATVDLAKVFNALAVHNKICEKLGDAPYQSNIIKILTHKNSLDTIENELKYEMFGFQKGYIGFNDGVYSFKEKRLLTKAEAIPLYITQSVGYNYEDVANVSDDTYNETMNFVNQILWDNTVRNWFICRLNRALQGLQEKLLLIAYDKKGNNGKSTLLDTLLSVVMGKYWVKMANTFLASKKTPSTGADEELVSLKDKAVAIISEPPKQFKLDIQKAKEIVGRDKLSGRGIFEKKGEFKFYGLMVILCNKIPNLEDKDEGGFTRIKVVPFESLFIDKDDKVDEENHIYKMNMNIDKKFDIYKFAFMKYLLSFTDKEFDEPEKVEIQTKKYRENEDDMKAFVNDKVEYWVNEPKPVFLSRMALWDEWKTYCKDNDITKPKLKEFNEDIMDYFPADSWKEDSDYAGVGRISRSWKDYRLKPLPFQSIPDEYDF
jgi:P4 family phage/plasmid primase-like protien